MAGPAMCLTIIPSVGTHVPSVVSLLLVAMGFMGFMSGKIITLIIQWHV